jgi:hypothetical protein
VPNALTYVHLFHQYSCCKLVTVVHQQPNSSAELLCWLASSKVFACCMPRLNSGLVKTLASGPFTRSLTPL